MKSLDAYVAKYPNGAEKATPLRDRALASPGLGAGGRARCRAAMPARGAPAEDEGDPLAAARARTLAALPVARRDGGDRIDAIARLDRRRPLTSPLLAGARRPPAPPAEGRAASCRLADPGASDADDSGGLLSPSRDPPPVAPLP